MMSLFSELQDQTKAYVKEIVFWLTAKGFMLTLQKTWWVHDSMNRPKIDPMGS